MHKLFKTAAGVALAIALGTPAMAQDTMTIGLLVPTTGSEATYGQDMANAANLAFTPVPRRYRHDSPRHRTRHHDCPRRHQNRRYVF